MVKQQEIQGGDRQAMEEELKTMEKQDRKECN